MKKFSKNVLVTFLTRDHQKFTVPKSIFDTEPNSFLSKIITHQESINGCFYVNIDGHNMNKILAYISYGIIPDDDSQFSFYISYFGLSIRKDDFEYVFDADSPAIKKIYGIHFKNITEQRGWSIFNDFFESNYYTDDLLQARFFRTKAESLSGLNDEDYNIILVDTDTSTTLKEIDYYYTLFNQVFVVVPVENGYINPRFNFIPFKHFISLEIFKPFKKFMMIVDKERLMSNTAMLTVNQGAHIDPSKREQILSIIQKDTLANKYLASDSPCIHFLSTDVLEYRSKLKKCVDEYLNKLSEYYEERLPE